DQQRIPHEDRYTLAGFRPFRDKIREKPIQPIIAGVDNRALHPETVIEETPEEGIALADIGRGRQVAVGDTARPTYRRDAVVEKVGRMIGPGEDDVRRNRTHQGSGIALHAGDLADAVAEHGDPVPEWDGQDRSRRRRGGCSLPGGTVLPADEKRRIDRNQLEPGSLAGCSRVFCRAAIPADDDADPPAVVAEIARDGQHLAIVMHDREDEEDTAHQACPPAIPGRAASQVSRLTSCHRNIMWFSRGAPEATIAACSSIRDETFATL